ncbi:MAG: hypothetical protein LAN63_08170 [Acidobacteriia bacterium]|nr:hypothetical protein [Terriglobia bacterium]
MFYYNAKYKFALPGQSPSGIAGAIIAASAMPAGQLLRRDFRKYPYLQHRLFDSQLYLSSLDPNVAPTAVVNLASWPWFCPNAVPEYDSDTHASVKHWKDLHADTLLQSWPNCLPNHPQAIRSAARASVQAQLDLGCEMVILPGPLTTIATQQFAVETEWIDAGLEVCRALKVATPVLATVGISDAVLRGVDPPQNPLLHTITNQLSARADLAGAYIVVEQASETGYVCTSRDTLLSLLLLIDDLVRGAGKTVLVNYVGTFGAVASAVGASVWSTGYYLSQRRLKLADFEDKIARAMPRYHSLRLAGDVGLQVDLERAYAQFGDRILTDTSDGRTLRQALESRTYPQSAPEWEYAQSNIAAAAGHYNEIAFKLGQFATLSPEKRIEMVQRWLEGAVVWSGNLQRIGIAQSTQTELSHQAVWLNAFQAWRSYIGPYQP